MTSKFSAKIAKISLLFPTSQVSVVEEVVVVCRSCPSPRFSTNPGFSSLHCKGFDIVVSEYLWPFPLAPGGGAWTEGKAEPPRPFLS